MNTPALSVVNLKKNYGGPTAAVKGISFEISKGEIFALIGPNGAGKSTTLRMLATLLSPTDGTATLFGKDLRTQPEEIRSMISYLPEEAGAYKNMRGNDYLTFMASLSNPDASSARAALTHAQEISALGNRLQDKVSTYSKGMTRKLLLARAMMNQPKLAILDEPTSGLDITNAMTIRTTIRDMAQQGLTVLLSSHNMLEIEFLSDRVGLIANGVLHDVGTPEELKKQHKARNLEEVFISATSGAH